MLKLLIKLLGRDRGQRQRTTSSNALTAAGETIPAASPNESNVGVEAASLGLAIIGERLPRLAEATAPGIEELIDVVGQQAKKARSGAATRFTRPSGDLRLKPATKEQQRRIAMLEEEREVTNPCPREEGAARI